MLKLLALKWKTGALISVALIALVGAEYWSNPGRFLNTAIMCRSTELNFQVRNLNAKSDENHRRSQSFHSMATTLSKTLSAAIATHEQLLPQSRGSVSYEIYVDDISRFAHAYHAAQQRYNSSNADDRVVSDPDVVNALKQDAADIYKTASIATEFRRLEDQIDIQISRQRKLALTHITASVEASRAAVLVQNEITLLAILPLTDERSQWDYWNETRGKSGCGGAGREFFAKVRS